MLQFIYDRLGFGLIFVFYFIWSSTIGQSQWSYLKTEFSEFNLLVLGTLIVSVIFYASFSTVLAIIDLYYYPSGQAKDIRVQPKKPPTLDMYKKALPVVIFNLGVLALPIGYSVFYYLHPCSGLNNPKGVEMFQKLPSVFTLMRDVGVSVLVEEVLFYYSHRLFHIPILYQWFHKKHHEFTAPIGISAVYTTPLDFLVSNVSPLLVGPLITLAHPVSVWAYFSIAIINTVVTHGGYELPCLPDAKLHDFHHETFNNMFGVIGLLDRIHGTDNRFRERYSNNKLSKAN